MFSLFSLLTVVRVYLIHQHLQSHGVKIHSALALTLLHVKLSHWKAGTHATPPFKCYSFYHVCPKSEKVTELELKGRLRRAVFLLLRSNLWIMLMIWYNNDNNAVIIRMDNSPLLFKRLVHKAVFDFYSCEYFFFPLGGFSLLSFVFLFCFQKNGWQKLLLGVTRKWRFCLLMNFSGGRWEEGGE